MNQTSLSELGKLNKEMGSLFSKVISKAIEKSKIKKSKIACVSISGQTIRHEIHKKDSFSQKWRIIDSEGGEIQNEKFQFNGMTYLRRSVEKSEEIIEESICIKWI